MRADCVNAAAAIADTVVRVVVGPYGCDEAVTRVARVTRNARAARAARFTRNAHVA